MRYIKTKDGKIHDMKKCFSEDFPFDPEHGITYEFEDGTKLNEHDIVAQADAVEELCDESDLLKEALE